MNLDIPQDAVEDHRKLSALYHSKFGRSFPLCSPVTFFEKLGWLKIFDRRRIYTDLADKFAVRDFVRGIVGEECLVPLVACFDSYRELTEEIMPHAGILKATHGWKMNFKWLDKSLVCWAAVRNKAKRWLETQHGLDRCEWNYRDVPRRLIVERLVEYSDSPPTDYKFYCFNGQVRLLHVGTPNGRIYLTPSWRPLELRWGSHKPLHDMPDCPQRFTQMLRVAENLATQLPFVRVDLYNVGGTILFGELTLFPSGGWAQLNPVIWDRRLGDWLDIQPVADRLLAKTNADASRHL